MIAISSDLTTASAQTNYGGFISQTNWFTVIIDCGITCVCPDGQMEMIFGGQTNSRFEVGMLMTFEESGTPPEN